jgi:hypothetical protein
VCLKLATALLPRVFGKATTGPVRQFRRSLAERDRIIAGEAKQSRLVCRPLDYFVAEAPRNDTRPLWARQRTGLTRVNRSRVR